MYEIEVWPDAVPDRGQEFAESCLATARSIAETVEDQGRSTEAQIRALENMRDGLRRWVER